MGVLRYSLETAHKPKSAPAIRSEGAEPAPGFNRFQKSFRCLSAARKYRLSSKVFRRGDSCDSGYFPVSSKSLKNDNRTH
ncbi:hypothetical protein NDU88_005140 [Pleurodeles waltl]|uniref:Uncharacterized protein n=1 Tax=Pleurodeles waltl TaxID=8319 RepID=A0AAV7TBD1_PLEWA|nr:hypothetical protein NDU88_005140 [Pleurodeles waltl]